MVLPGEKDNNLNMFGWGIYACYQQPLVYGYGGAAKGIFSICTCAKVNDRSHFLPQDPRRLPRRRESPHCSSDAETHDLHQPQRLGPRQVKRIGVALGMILGDRSAGMKQHPS